MPSPIGNRVGPASNEADRARGCRAPLEFTARTTPVSSRQRLRVLRPWRARRSRAAAVGKQLQRYGYRPGSYGAATMRSRIALAVLVMAAISAAGHPAGLRAAP